MKICVSWFVRAILFVLIEASFCEAYPTHNSVMSDLYGVGRSSSWLDSVCLYLALIAFVAYIIINGHIKGFVCGTVKVALLLIGIGVIVWGVPYLLTPMIGKEVTFFISLYLIYKFISIFPMNDKNRSSGI